MACDESDVNVTIGTEVCNVTSLASTQLVCIPPKYQPQSTDDYGLPTKTGLPLVVVSFEYNLTNLSFTINSELGYKII